MLGRTTTQNGSLMTMTTLLELSDRRMEFMAFTAKIAAKVRSEVRMSMIQHFITRQRGRYLSGFTSFFHFASTTTE